MRIKSLLPNLRVYDLPTRTLQLAGRGVAAEDRYIAEVTQEELESPQLTKALKKKWIRVLKDKKTKVVKKVEKKFEKKPVAITLPAVSEEKPNDSSDE